MISKLSSAQERKLAGIVDQWIVRALGVEQLTVENARKRAYKWDWTFFSRERQVLHLSSPLGCWFAVTLFADTRQQVDQQVRQQVEQQVEQQVWQPVGKPVWHQAWQPVWRQVEQQVGQQVWRQVEQQVGQQVWRRVEQPVDQQVRQQVGQQVWRRVEQQVDQQVWRRVEQPVDQQVRQQVGQQVWRQVGQQVWRQVEHQVDQQVQQQVGQFIWPYFTGHFWAGYFAWVSALRLIGVTIPASYDALEGCADLGLFYPLEKILIVGSKPTVLRRNAAGQLHSDGSCSIAYADGWALYHLNGVPMNPEHVLTPANKIDPRDVMKEENADRRRELIRKIGIERMESELKPKLLDHCGTYELLSINLSEEVNDARYLKMVNPSTGTFHIEGVSPECATVEHALNWRNNEWFDSADLLT